MRRHSLRRRFRQAGFTLAEMVIVIVITGIVASVVAVFIRTPVQGYVDSVARAELADSLDTAVRRITRDLRLALPNTVRVTNSGNTVFVELLLMRTAGRYLADEDGVGGNVFDFLDATDTSFQVVGPLDSDSRRTPQVGDQLVVYNLGQAPANAYSCVANSCNRTSITAVNVSSGIITMASNPFAQQQPVVMRSPARRFQVVESAVTYACNLSTGRLTRYSGYAIQAAQPVSEGSAPLSNAVNGVLIDNVSACTFTYDSFMNNARIGLIGMTLTVQRADAGSVTLFHQIQVNNTP